MLGQSCPFVAYFVKMDPGIATNDRTPENVRECRSQVEFRPTYGVSNRVFAPLDHREFLGTERRVVVSLQDLQESWIVLKELEQISQSLIFCQVGPPGI
jgi:hypothetical protein